MYTSSSRSPWRKAFCTSSWRNDHPLLTAIERIILIVVALTTGIKVSS
jgi:hypothetical protein